MKKHTKWFDSAIIKEDGSKKASNERHFVLNNGTRKAIFSPSPMNYFDEEEKVWKPIDNSLKKTGDGYVARLGKYTATLSKKDENESVEVRNGDDLISWEYLGNNVNLFSGLEKGGNSSAAKRSSKLKVKTKIRDSFDLSSASRAVFADAEGDVDLDYSIESNGVKEGILIKEKSDSYHYYFRIRVAGFEMRPAADGVGLEFYKTGIDPEQAEAQTPEFVMPAPFMYDANGEHTDDIRFSVERIEEGVYLFSVEASSEWINAKERVFPVCIDPQLLNVNGSNFITVSQDEYQLEDCEVGSCYEPEWIHVGNPQYSFILLKSFAEERITAKAHIEKRDINIAKNSLITASLVFQQCSGQNTPNSVQVRIGNNHYNHVDGNIITADITSLYNAANDSFDVELSMDSLGGVRSFSLPTLLIEYKSIRNDLGYKTFPVGDGASARVDIVSGDETMIMSDIEDPVLGVAVSHIYKPNDEVEEYGRNFRLNLNEKLIKTSANPTGVQYAYTDALGDVHTFNEHFYRIDVNGSKVYLTTGIDLITADSDGRLWLEGTEVFRELTTDSGLRASARLEKNVNNAEWVEQRLDEEKQAEEQTRSYRDMLSNFVSVGKTSGVISDEIDNEDLATPEFVEVFFSGVDGTATLLLPKEEALAYKSLITQKESLNSSKEALELQLRSVIDNAKSLLLQYNTPDSFAYQKKSNRIQKASLALQVDSFTECQCNNCDLMCLIGEEDVEGETQFGLIKDSDNLIDAQEAQWSIQKGYIAEQIKGFPFGREDLPEGIQLPNVSGIGTLAAQYSNTADQINIIDVQMTDCCTQINLYVHKSDAYCRQFRSYYKEYLVLKKQLERMKEQIPVAYLISDNAVKGFNSVGELVLVQNKYGNYIAVEREEYTVGKNRIVSISNQDGKAMRFFYNGNNKLSEIRNSIGDNVRFEYDDDGALIGIKRNDLPSLSLSYITSAGKDCISQISASNYVTAKIDYISGKMRKITRTSTAVGIAHNTVTEDSEVTLSYVEMDYSVTETELTYDGGKKEIFKIDQPTERVSEKYGLVYGKVASAVRYQYNSDGFLIKTEYADTSCLNRYSYAAFAAHIEFGTVEETTYNDFEEPVMIVCSKYAIPRAECDCPIEQISAEFFYNDDHQLIEKRTTHCYGCCFETNDATVTVEKYFYDNAGEVVRTEAYVEGEELTTGVTVEEHFFNDQGVEIRSTTYNSLDPSSKFYTEYEVDAKGKVLSAFDETGEHKTAFDYERDDLTVRTKCYPNGSKFSFGRDKEGTAVSITQSTESGEENSTKQVLTLDLVTEVKSGNNTIHYAYDEKRRVKSVSLNKDEFGEDEAHVSYEYSENQQTHAETVRAEMKSGFETTCIRDEFGNITDVICKKPDTDHPGQMITTSSLSNAYNEEHQLSGTVDRIGKVVVKNEFDDHGNVVSVSVFDLTNSGIDVSNIDASDLDNLILDTPVLKEEMRYEEHGNALEEKTIWDNDVELQSYQYAYKQTAGKGLESITINDDTTIKPVSDALGRNVGKTIEFPDKKLSERISYVKFGDHATNLPSTIRFGVDGKIDDNLQYKYDSMGNIIKVTENGRQIRRYEYDALGRLIREDNLSFGKTTTWAYDNNGNIIASYEYAITTSPTDTLQLRVAIPSSYIYADDSDRLISYYNGETGDASFGYDDIGNPTTYRGKTATWANGRQMTSYDGLTFEYDALGRRTKKGSITFTYDSNGNLVKQSNGLEFLYDHTGVFAVKYDNATYYYRKDAQGNVIALLDNTGAVVVKYAYDAWGNCLTTVRDINATGIADLNPFRYRGYYYDVETKLYFLKTRYYDPEIGRFITIDDISYLDPNSINGLNLYAYCGNNPVMGYDPNGTTDCEDDWDWIPIIGFFVSAATVTIATAGAVASGAWVAVAIGTAVGGAIGFGVDVGIQLKNNGGNFKAVDYGSAFNSALVGAALGFSYSMGVTCLGPVLAGEATIGLTAGKAYAISTLVSFSAGSLGYIVEEKMNDKDPSFGKALMNGGLVALAGTLKFVFGGVVGSVGHLGTKGKPPVRSKEWWGKLVFGQEFTMPFKILIDYLRKNL